MYSTYLVKVGTNTIPLSYISRGTYKASADRIIAGKHTDGFGIDHYDVLSNRKLNVELTITACPASIYSDIITLIKNSYINANEENVLVTAYVPKLDAYVSQECLFTDESPAVNAIVDGKLVYEKVKLKFEGKGGAIS